MKSTKKKEISRKICSLSCDNNSLFIVYQTKQNNIKDSDKSIINLAAMISLFVLFFFLKPHTQQISPLSLKLPSIHLSLIVLFIARHDKLFENPFQAPSTRRTQGVIIIFFKFSSSSLHSFQFLQANFYLFFFYFSTTITLYMKSLDWFHF